MGASDICPWRSEPCLSYATTAWWFDGRDERRNTNQKDTAMWMDDGASHATANYMRLCLETFCQLLLCISQPLFLLYTMVTPEDLMKQWPVNLLSILPAKCPHAMHRGQIESMAKCPGMANLFYVYIPFELCSYPKAIMPMHCLGITAMTNLYIHATWSLFRLRGDTYENALQSYPDFRS